MNARRGVTTLVLLFLGSAAATETVAAQGQPVPFAVPQWTIHVGLAMLCPDEIKAIIQDRVGSGSGDSQ